VRQIESDQQWRHRSGTCLQTAEPGRRNVSKATCHITPNDELVSQMRQTS